MPRNNADFQHSVMYHGSHRSFEVGDIIYPASHFETTEQQKEREKRGIKTLNERVTHAYATNEPKYAKVYGKNVYQVKPIKPQDVEAEQVNLPNDPRAADVNTVIGKNSPTYSIKTKTGFKVIGEHDGT